MTNQYIEQLDQKTVVLGYNAFGNVVCVNLNDANSSTAVPIGNPNFKDLITYIDAKGISPKLNLQWAQIVVDSKGHVLFYRTNLGDFVDDGNAIAEQIKQGIESKEIEIKENINESPWVELEVSIFLSRSYLISNLQIQPIECYEFGENELSLPFSVRVSLLQTIEADYLDSNYLLFKEQKNLLGNVIRLQFSQLQIESAFKWFVKQFGLDNTFLSDSRDANLALHKRSKNRGPTTNWYFEWMNLQQYIWGPALEVANRLVGLMNHQAHRKTMGLMSHDDLGDVSCLKVKKLDGTSYMWPLSSLSDKQINIFPKELNWNRGLLQLSFNRVQQHLDRSLYFEAIVVAQASVEAIINGMFSKEVLNYCYGKRNIKWEQKYTKLKYFLDSRDEKFLKQSALYSYLNGDLHRIYELRNGYAHDIFEHLPNYDFTLSKLKEISTLLKPITDWHESAIFLNAVEAMYTLKPEFHTFLRKLRE